MAYEDIPHMIGYSADSSAPHMHALCLKVLEDHVVEGARFWMLVQEAVISAHALLPWLGTKER